MACCIVSMGPAACVVVEVHPKYILGFMFMIGPTRWCLCTRRDNQVDRSCKMQTRQTQARVSAGGRFVHCIAMQIRSATAQNRQNVHAHINMHPTSRGMSGQGFAQTSSIWYTNLDVLSFWKRSDIPPTHPFFAEG